jgi:predicted nucleic acid-binding protein
MIYASAAPAIMPGTMSLEMALSNKWRIFSRDVRIDCTILSEERYELVISPELFAEFVEVSNRHEIKTRIELQRKLALFRRLRQDAIWTTGAIEAQGLLTDPQDDFLMSAALEVEAEFIVTWDSLLLDQRNCQGVKILSPDQFIALVVRR